MKKPKYIFILINLIVVLLLFNRSVWEKEETLSTGKLALLELIPVDPRSLMQGDYMRLRYAISRGSSNDSMAKRGYCIIKLDKRGVGSKVRFQDDIVPLHDGEYAIRYTNSSNISIGAESYFFEEGQAEKYEAAKYGGMKIDNHGNNILVGLYDENLNKITPEKE